MADRLGLSMSVRITEVSLILRSRNGEVPLYSKLHAYVIPALVGAEE